MINLSRFERTELILGKENFEKLQKSHVAVFGVGGVGGYAVEALARSGVGHITLTDNDMISESNINRQIIALSSTVGKYKTRAAKERIADINPDCVVETHELFYTPDTSEMIDFSGFDYIIDAIDTVTGKIEIILNANKASVPVISSMGAGNKLDPTAFEIADIYETTVCPLARVMRRELKKRGIEKLNVVYSKEKPRETFAEAEPGVSKMIPGSIAFVPSAAGLVIASKVITDLIGWTREP